MWHRALEAKRPMHKHSAPPCSRPVLDLLEGRYLLSGWGDGAALPSAPAVIFSLGPQAPTQLVTVRLATAPLAQFQGPLSWSMSPSLFRQDLNPSGNHVSLLAEAQLAPGLPGASPSLGYLYEVDHTTISLWNSGNAVALPPALSPHAYDSALPLLPPLSYQLMPFTDPTGHFQIPRIRLDDAIMRMAREPFAKSLLDESMTSSSETADQIQGMTATLNGPVWSSTATGNLTSQITPTDPTVPAHTTTLLNSDISRIEPTARALRISGSSSNQPSETAQGALPKTVSANLVPTSALTAATLAEDDQAAELFPTISGPVVGSDQEKFLLPLPHAAELVTEAVPFDRASLERAIDQFFNRLEELGVGELLVEQGPAHTIPLSLALLGTVTALELARRRFQPTSGRKKAAHRQSSLGSEELLGFPELPGSWSTRLT